MTLKFVEPDEPTKTALGELEKARLAMKPAPLSIVPRASDVAGAAAPDPAAGRGPDRCIERARRVRRDRRPVAAWTDGAAAEGPSSGKFVIPTIPQMGAPRPKTPSVPPALQPKSRRAQATAGARDAAADRATAEDRDAADRRAVVEGRAEDDDDGHAGDRSAARDRAEARAETRAGAERCRPVISATTTKQGITPPPTATTMGMTPTALRRPTPLPRRDPTPLPKKNETVQIPKREIAIGKQTTLGMPIVRPPADTLESPSPPPPTPASTGAAAPRRAHTPSTPPAPRHPTPYAPLPIVRKPRERAIAPLVDCRRPPSDRSARAAARGEEQRKTSLGVSEADRIAGRARRDELG